MSAWPTRTLACCLAALLTVASAAGQSLVGPQPTGPKDRHGGVVSLGDGGGSELPGKALSSAKTGGPGSAVPPGKPGAPTLGPGTGGGGGGGGGGVVVPPDDDPPGGDDGHGDGGDDGGDKDPPGDGSTPGGADDPPDDGNTPGTGSDAGPDPGADAPDAPGPTRWRLEVSAEPGGLLLRLERLDGPTRLAVTWRLVLPRPAG